MGEGRKMFPGCEVSPTSSYFQMLRAVLLSSLTLPDGWQGFCLAELSRTPHP